MSYNISPLSVSIVYGRICCKLLQMVSLFSLSDGIAHVIYKIGILTPQKKSNHSKLQTLALLEHMGCMEELAHHSKVHGVFNQLQTFSLHSAKLFLTFSNLCCELQYSRSAKP